MPREPAHMIVICPAQPGELHKSSGGNSALWLKNLRANRIAPVHKVPAGNRSGMF
ncbi:hypothetical protein SCH4B_3819 [Ruegeria sp. TrichCH4B]|nr:hypothetical protein SCH4B_3819 [Ruegeria sp. TrichCH4B]